MATSGPSHWPGRAMRFKTHPCDSNYRLLERPWKIFKTITLKYILQDEAQAVTVKLDIEWFIHDSLASISASSATDLNLERIQIPHSNLLCGYLKEFRFHTVTYCVNR